MIGAVLGAKHVRVRRQRGVVLRLLVQQQEHADAGHEQHARRGDADGLVQIHHPCCLFLKLSSQTLTARNAADFCAIEALAKCETPSDAKRSYSQNACCD